MTGHFHSSFGLGLSVNGRNLHRTTAGGINTNKGDDSFISLLDLFSQVLADLTPSDVMWSISDTG